MSRTQIAIAIVSLNGQFLVGQRPEGKALAGYWEFPGGKVEPGESPIQAAARECLEEAGVEVEPAETFATVQHDYEHGAVELHFVACQCIEREPAPQSSFRWVSRDELADLTFPAANKSVVARLVCG